VVASIHILIMGRGQTWYPNVPNTIGLPWRKLKIILNVFKHRVSHEFDQ